jgi:tetratricopeptide (TPR) repeat protein
MRAFWLVCGLLACRSHGTAPAPGPQGTGAPSSAVTVASSSVVTVAPSYALATHPSVQRIDQQIGILRARAAQDARDWISYESIAQRALERAKLTGDYNDYKVAEDAIAAAFARAVPGSGPLWLRANVDFTLHRIAKAEQDLDAVEKKALVPYGEKLGVMTMRARIAYFKGEYAKALTLLDAMKPEDRTSGEHVARAEILSHTGRVVEARKVLDGALQAKGASKGYISLAYGLLELDAGRYKEAQVHYETALKEAPDSWLFEEHLAEVLAKQGLLDQAGHHYVDLIRRTENPEFMDALASIYEQKNVADKARELRARANALFDERVRLFPEAAAGHALAHYFDVAPERTVSLAEANHKARPYGESAVGLAKALLVNGRATEAKGVIDAVLQTAWRTAETHVVAAQVFEKMGDPRAASERTKALTINPHAFASPAALDGGKP